MTTNPNLTLSLSKVDVMNLALAAADAGTTAYIEDRHVTAATNHGLAARLWECAGYADRAKHHAMLATSISVEMIELAAGEDEEAG